MSDSEMAPTQMVRAPRDPLVDTVIAERYRILARIDGKQVKLFTRNGNDWTSKMAQLERETAALGINSACASGMRRSTWFCLPRKVMWRSIFSSRARCSIIGWRR